MAARPLTIQPTAGGIAAPRARVGSGDGSGGRWGEYTSTQPQPSHCGDMIVADAAGRLQPQKRQACTYAIDTVLGTRLSALSAHSSRAHTKPPITHAGKMGSRRD